MDARSDYSESEPESPGGNTRTQQLFIPSDATPEPVESSLEDAINTAAIEELRAMVQDFVRAHADVRETVSKRLLKPISGSDSRKRKAFETCLHCGKDYGIADNTEGSCVHHKGLKEPDYSHLLLEDAAEGFPLPDEDDPEFMEAFQWTCCRRHGNAPGCVVTKHTPVLADEERMRQAVRVA